MPFSASFTMSSQTEILSAKTLNFLRQITILTSLKFMFNEKMRGGGGGGGGAGRGVGGCCKKKLGHGALVSFRTGDSLCTCIKCPAILAEVLILCSHDKEIRRISSLSFLIM